MSKLKLDAALRKEYDSIASILYTKELVLDTNPFVVKSIGRNVIDLTWSGKNSTSNILFDEEKSCIELLESIRSERQYTFLTYDKSIIQAEYKIENDTVIKGRLLFLKLQNKVWRHDEILEYADDPNRLDDMLNEELGLPIMIRVDFDPRNHIDCHHPKAHCVFSNVKDCRIPMKSVLSLGQFVDFIFRQFYHVELPRFDMVKFDETITDSESKLIHINW